MSEHRLIYIPETQYGTLLTRPARYYREKAIRHRNRGNSKALRRAREPILMSPERAAFILWMRKTIVEMLKPLVLAELKHRYEPQQETQHEGI